MEAIAKAIEQYLTHTREAEDMGDRARKIILENYTWDQVAVKMQQIYQSILQFSTVDS